MVQLAQLASYLNVRDRFAKERTRMVVAALEWKGRDDGEYRVAKLNLAQALAGSSKVSEATVLAREVIDSRSRTMGAAHPETLRAMRILASFLESDGDHGEADDLWQQILAAMKENAEQAQAALVDAVESAAAARERAGLDGAQPAK